MVMLAIETLLLMAAAVAVGFFLGVVGKQPLLQPGESFEYTSGSSLTTPIGTMKGTYQMVGEDGTRFDAEIPEFVLAAPGMLH